MVEPLPSKSDVVDIRREFCGKLVETVFTFESSKSLSPVERYFQQRMKLNAVEISMNCAKVPRENKFVT